MTADASDMCLELGIKEDDLYEKSIDEFKDSNSKSPKEHDIAAMKHMHYEKRR